MFTAERQDVLLNCNVRLVESVRSWDGSVWVTAYDFESCRPGSSPK